MERVPESEAIAEMADARRFNEFMGGNRFRQQEYRRLARQAVELGVPPGGKVLDVGTGPGFVAIEVARLLQGDRLPGRGHGSVAGDADNGRRERGRRRD